MPNTIGQKSLLEQMQDKRAEARRLIGEVRSALPNATASEARDLKSALDKGNEHLAAIEERIVELEEQEAREDAARRHYVGPGTVATRASTGGRSVEIRTAAGVKEVRGIGWIPGGNSVTESPIYADPYKVPHGPSFFRDLYRSQNQGDWEASDRLRRSQMDRPKMEIRALGNTGGAGGSGGELAPPAWLVEDFVKLARPASVTANLLNTHTMLEGVSSINIPKVSTGTTVALQTTQNTALSQTDLTTGSLSSPIDTIGGKQLVSQQLLDQSGVPFDRLVMTDLSAAYARSKDIQVLTSTGTGNTYRGLAAGAGVGTTAYTTGSPKVIDATTSANSFYNAVIRAINSIYTTRFLPPTAIVMSPTRWSWILEALDSSGRPLVLTDGAAFNALGLDGPNVAEGLTGVFCNLPVFVDPNIPANLGAGTNQDEVFVLRSDDVWFWESPLVCDTFREPYADSMGVLFRCYAYTAMIPDRYGASVNIIGGTGLVAPTL